MAKSEASVDELVGMIERGELRLPEMQRRYVWKKPRVRDLLDSLYRGYPSGAILLWETDEDVPLQDFAITQEKNPYQNTKLLLDGQQRLTSLAAIVRGKTVAGRSHDRPIELLFNLEHPDKLEVVTEVEEDDGDNDDDLISDEADSNEDELLQRFNKMTFVVATRKLEQLPQWVKVTEVFQTDSDRAFLKRAGITDLDDPRSEKYSQRLARLRGVKKYIYRMDILERSLSYEEVTEIFVRVNSLGAKGRYSRGSSETLLDQDLTTLKQKGGAQELIERLRQQVGRLDVSPAELEGRNQRSSLFKTMFLAFRDAGAKDWRSNLAIAHDHSGSQHKLQFHHIFPKAVLKSTYPSRDADDIANLAFIGGKTNRAISDKPPVDYFPPLIEKAGVGAFAVQCIPTDPSLLGLAEYKAFLLKRRELIAQCLNAFLGTPPTNA
jgi:hypothetical protein